MAPTTLVVVVHDHWWRLMVDVVDVSPQGVSRQCGSVPMCPGVPVVTIDRGSACVTRCHCCYSYTVQW